MATTQFAHGSTLRFIPADYSRIDTGGTITFTALKQTSAGAKPPGPPDEQMFTLHSGDKIAIANDGSITTTVAGPPSGI